MVTSILKDGLTPLECSANAFSKEVGINIKLPFETTFKIDDSLHVNEISVVTANNLRAIGEWLLKLIPDSNTQHTSTYYEFLQDVASLLLTGTATSLVYTHAFNLYLHDDELGWSMLSVILTPQLSPNIYPYGVTV